MIIEFLIILFIIITDLVTKEWVMPLIADSTKVFLPKFFTFEFAINDGATFGMFAGNKFLLLYLPLLFSLGVFLFLMITKYIQIIKNDKFKNNLFKEIMLKSDSLRLGLVFISAGGLANLSDRFIYGFVRDFIRYDFIETIIKRPFAIGNLADIFVLFGGVLIVLYLIKLLVKPFFTYEQVLEYNGKTKSKRK